MQNMTPNTSIKDLISWAMGTPVEFIAAIKNSVRANAPIEDAYRLAGVFGNCRSQFSEEQLSELFTFCVKAISGLLLQVCNQEGPEQENSLRCARDLSIFTIGAARRLILKRIPDIKGLSKADFDEGISIAGNAAIRLMCNNCDLKHRDSITCLLIGRAISESVVVLFESVPDLNVSLSLDRKLFLEL